VVLRGGLKENLKIALGMKGRIGEGLGRKKIEERIVPEKGFKKTADVLPREGLMGKGRGY